MISTKQNLKKIILILGDLAIFQGSLLATLWIRYGAVTQTTWQQHLWPFAILSAVWLAVFYIAGLYDLLIMRDTLKVFRIYIEAMVANLGLAVAFFYLIPWFGIAPRTNLFLDFALVLLLGYFWRMAFKVTLADKLGQGNLLYIGPTREIRPLCDLIERSSIGFTLTSALTIDGLSDPSLNLHWFTEYDQLPAVIKQQQISTIVLGVNPDQHPELKKSLYHALFSPIRFLDRAEIEEATTGRIPLSHVNESWFLSHLKEIDKTWYEGVKRIVDILLSIPFLIVSLALLPFIALAIKLGSRGPIFYSQERVGRYGKAIRIWKYRSMHTDAEAQGPQFPASTKDDPRVTGVGRFLRQTRLDELPQLWNVIHGDLSFIGPRPERPEFVTPLVEKMPYYALRHLTRPGLTGWAQVRFLTPIATLDDNLTKLQYDLYYIKNRSLLLDAAILLKTVGIVLRRQGT
ncbi:MAG: sugar transferase [bacterium]|nr:sugar transferase [bacterium]